MRPPGTSACRTDDEGRCLLRALAAGTFEIFIPDQNPAGAAMDVARSVTTTAHVRWGEIAEAALVIPGVHKAITGTVVRNEMPVPGARVTATSSAGTQARPLWTTTDTDGNFRLPCLREGDYTLHATAPPALRSMDVTVPTGESAALQLYSEHDDD